MCLGIPGKVVEIVDIDNALVTIEVGSVKRQVNVSCVASDSREVSNLINCWVLVHVGFAMMIIDEQEALKTLALIQQWSDLADDQAH